MGPDRGWLRLNSRQRERRSSQSHLRETPNQKVAPDLPDAAERRARRRGTAAGPRSLARLLLRQRRNSFERTEKPSTLTERFNQMSRKNTQKSFLKKLAQVPLILLLASSGSLALARGAAAQVNTSPALCSPH